MTASSSQQPSADTPTGQGTFVATVDQTGGAVQNPLAGGTILPTSKSDIELAKLYKTLRFGAIIIGPALGALITYMLYQVISPLADVKSQLTYQQVNIEKLETKVDSLQRDLYARPIESTKSQIPPPLNIPKNPVQ